jgi:tRNA A-37 threonylcarbamoyl transferase component Bud32
MQNNMSGKQPIWILSDDFKNQFTPSELTALIARAGEPASGCADMELRSCTGFRAGAAAARFLKQWEIARAAQACGIALRRPIAIGCCKRLGFIREAYLVVETIPAGLSLKDCLDRHGPRPDFINLPEDRDLMDLFAAFAAQLRKVCRLSVDFHLGDVLLRVDAEGRPCLYLADMDKVALKRPGTGRTRIDNLRMLDAVLWGRAPSRAQLLFMRMYLRRLADWCETVLRACRRLADMPGELRFFSGRCGKDADMRKLALRDLRGYMKRGEHEAALLRLLEDPDALFSRHDATILKNSRTTAALLLQAPELAWPVYLKRYNFKGPLFACKYLLRRSRAQRAAQTACALRARDVPTPEVLAFLDRRRFGFLQAAYLLTRALPGAEGLDQYAEKRFPGWQPDEKRIFIAHLAAMLKAAHGQGMLHGDLKAKNILVAADGRGSEKIYFIDLDATRLRAAAPLSERCRDLARLNCSFLNTALVSRTHRLLFLHHYVEGDPQAGLKDAWNMVLELSWRKLLKSQRAFISQGIVLIALALLRLSM